MAENQRKPEPWSSRRTESKLLNMNKNTKKKRCGNQNVTAHAKRRKQGILELQIIVCLNHVFLLILFANHYA